MTTRLRIASDLHVEFHADKGAAILDEVISGGEDYDVLVLAGDISDFEHLPATLERICKATSDVKKKCFYVMGNHEAYGGTIGGALDVIRSFDDESENVFFYLLENNWTEWSGLVGGVEMASPRFLGTTLWYPHPRYASNDPSMGDFNHIGNISGITGVGAEIHRRAMEAKEFLFDGVEEGSVVITHFLPHPKSILPQWQNSPLNSYFLHDVSEVVCGRGAKLWIHGHTHGSLDYMVAAPGANPTRVVCNPLGYARGMRGEPNANFDPTLIIEV